MKAEGSVSGLVQKFRQKGKGLCSSLSFLNGMFMLKTKMCMNQNRNLPAFMGKVYLEEDLLFFHSPPHLLKTLISD